MHEPPQLAPFDSEEQRLYSKRPSDVWSPRPISKAKPHHPPDKPHSRLLYHKPCPFGHHPDLMTISEGRNIDGMVNQQVCLAANLFHHDGVVQQPQYKRCHPNSPIHLPLHPHPEILKLLCSGSLPSQTHSWPWLHPDILCMKIQNRIGDDGSLGRVQHPRRKWST